MKNPQSIIGSLLSLGAFALLTQATALAQTNAPVVVVNTNPVVIVTTNGAAVTNVVAPAPVPPPPQPAEEKEKRFHSGEIDLSPFGLYVDRAGGKWGGGAALTFYPIKNLGIGAATFMTDTKGTFFDNVQGEGYFRLPLLRIVAPYAVGSFGYQFDHDYSFETFGLGVDFRPLRNLGAFADGQYLVSNNHSKAGNSPFIRIGLRLVW